MKYIKFFKDIKISDISSVGGKNASLGQMISNLSSAGVRIPNGFAITAGAYWYFLEHNNLLDKIKAIMLELKDYRDAKILKKVSVQIRSLIENGNMPLDLQQEIEQAYKDLCDGLDPSINHPTLGATDGMLGRTQEGNTKDFSLGHAGLGKGKFKNYESFALAVRSSATAEDLPGASFAGQQETFLNVSGVQNLIEACKKCMSSLFTERAIVYRIDKGFDYLKVGLSVGVQKMVRSDLASAGVIFTLDTESGFADVITINSSFGLGEIVVQGAVIPDEFFVHKPTLEAGFSPIIKKSLGDKNNKIVYAQENLGFFEKYFARIIKRNITESVVTESVFTKTVKTSLKERNSFTLSDSEILELARYALIIEAHYSKINNKWTPMDIEWAKDGVDGKLYILQARPETIYGANCCTGKNGSGFFKTYKLKDAISVANKVLLTGQSIGNKIVSGKVKVIKDAKDISQVQVGDILVTQMTDPDWVPVMKKASAIITDRGGRTCHAAIVSRELSIPAIVGTKNGTDVLKNGQEVTIDCSQGQTGFIYSGIHDFEVIEIESGLLTTENMHKNYNCEIMVNIADPAKAFMTSFLPNDGVGLARIEFIVSNIIQIHPMALIKPEVLKDQEVIEKINYITRAYENKCEFFVDSLAYGIANIAAAFYKKPVIVRFSDFKTNEYRNLLGGKYFEPEEENPMIGWRGASRYYNQNYSPAFALECKAIKKCREQMGLTNIKVMIPFVRTLQEAELVLKELEKNGLKRGARITFGASEISEKVGGNMDDNGLEIIMMCEIPSNVILIEEFCRYFDGFSIGSNDLTQLTLGVDRDSGILSKLFDESDLAVEKMMGFAIEGAKRGGKHIGICGQAPSDLPQVARFLISSGINSISLNPDSLGQFLTKFK